MPVLNAMRRAGLILSGFGAVGLAACGGGSSASSPPASHSAGAAATVTTGSTSLGTVLTNAGGRTLYYFLPEKGGVVACTGGCATTWPALTATGSPTGGNGVTGSLGMVGLPGGGQEVTYNSWPLHTYAGDSGPGQTNGQGIGGKWFAATPGLTSSGGGAGSSPGSGTSSASPATTPYGY